VKLITQMSDATRRIGRIIRQNGLAEQRFRHRRAQRFREFLHFGARGKGTLSGEDRNLSPRVQNIRSGLQCCASGADATGLLDSEVRKPWFSIDGLSAETFMA